MDTNTIERLKVAVNQFYLQKYMDQPLMSDLEFDELRKLYENEFGSVKNLVEWESDLTRVNNPMEPLQKMQVKDNQLKVALQNWLDENKPESHYIFYKYDGSSIKAYYKDGKLYQILGTPDEEYGIVRTEAFWNLFPHEVDPVITTIQGEVLCDAVVYGQLARNAANGLTNSKYKVAEVEQEAFIRVYRLEFADGNWSSERNYDYLHQLPVIYKDRYRLHEDQLPELGDKKFHHDLVFAPAYTVSMESIPETPIVAEGSVDFQVDGIVCYSSIDVLGFKFYYTESNIVEVLNVNWNKKLNGSYAPVLQLETSILNDKTINKVTAGGVPNLMKMKMGRGARVRVILANMTIPKVIEVLEPSEDYQWPVCGCGYQMGPDDIYGSTLKCQEESVVCVDKYQSWYTDICNNIAYDEEKQSMTFEQYFTKWFDWFMNYLFIDRWSFVDSQVGTISIDEEVQLILRTLEDRAMDNFYEIISNHHNLTDLNYATLNINYKATWQTFLAIKENWDKITPEMVEQMNNQE